MNARKLLSAAKAVEPVFIEDTFAVYLYTGNGSTQTITNGIDLSGKGGLIWQKNRGNPTNHYLVDTVRGANKSINSDTTSAQATSATSEITSFNSDGYGITASGSTYNTNVNGQTYVSWTFRKQAKFFDVVTYTGNGAVGRNIPHNLGSTPGCIIVKDTGQATNWPVYHRSRSTTQQTIFLNSAGAFSNDNAFGNPTSTNIVVGGNPNFINENGQTYVAYLFAHDAGGFGASGSDNVITCGSFTTDGSGNATVTLGYEPQWVMIKRSSSIGDWTIVDTMRGLPVKTNSQRPLFPNTSAAEAVNSTNAIFPTATGFVNDATYLGAGNTYIYIAIRRGPMKTPTTGTSVFAPATRTGTGTTATVTTTISPVDMLFSTNRDRVASSVNSFWDRLRGGGIYLDSNATSAEASNTSVSGFDVQNGVTMQGGLITNGNSYPYVNWNFRRAPGFFDVVCNEGDGTTNRAISHNLGVVPELLIGKNRNASGADFNWQVGSPLFSSNQVMQLNLTSALNAVGAPFGTTAATSTQFRVGADAGNSYIMNRAAQQYVYYLFATCPGVSKVGTYTGTGNTLQIDCGFTGGARFVLIKRTDSTGDWYVWDSARGIVSGNDPYLLLNSTAAEVTSTDYVDTYSAGFEISSTAPAAINANGGSFIFLAIA